MTRVGSVLKRMFRAGMSLLAVFALVLVLLAFTSIPFSVHRWLGSSAGMCSEKVDRIVVLGGSGMPSGPELLRLHRAATLAAEHPASTLMVIHPQGSDVLQAMVQELLLRGVSMDRITVMPGGDNTREQALIYAKFLVGSKGSTAVVTAPENMYRSIKTFRKAGVDKVCGVPAWDHAMPHDFRYDHSAIGGKGYVPDVSGSPGIRYTVWNYLKLEITCLREFVAIAYYQLNGWI